MEISTYFEQIEDYRVVNRCLHSLSDILGLILLGTLASCDDYSEIIDFGYDYQDELCKCLGFSFDNGIPSADTLERMMGRIDPNHLENAFKSCLEDLNLVGKHVAFDGKELRGTIPSGKKKAEIQMVNAWVNDYEISVGQQRISKKSNEITAIPELLDLFDYTGSIITIDAIGCQKSIINKIIAKEAHYLIALKQNQGTLYEQIYDFVVPKLSELPQSKSEEIAHSRFDKREVFVLNDLKFIDEAELWNNLKSVIVVRRNRVLKNGKEESSITLYISSLEGVTAEEYGMYIRNHWGIENKLHWQLDFTFKEDHSKVRRDHAAENLHLVRKWSMHILKKDSTKISLKRKRKKARKFEYLVHLLSL